MKTREHIPNARKNLKRPFSSENLWFFSDNESDDVSLPKVKEPARNDQESISLKNYRRKQNETQTSSKSAECSFIVDWQL